MPFLVGAKWNAHRGRIAALTIFCASGGCRSAPEERVEAATIEVAGGALLVRGVKVLSVVDGGARAREAEELVVIALKSKPLTEREPEPLIRVEPATRYDSLLSIVRALSSGDIKHARLACTKEGRLASRLLNPVSPNLMGPSALRPRFPNVVLALTVAPASQTEI